MPRTVESLTVGIRFQLHGRVQGVGVRPAVARLATRRQLVGSIRNTTSGVEILAAGDPLQLVDFERTLLAALPDAARVSELLTEPWLIAELPAEFIIGVSLHSAGPAACVPPDLAVCSSCRAEAHSPDSRRHEYPLMTCATCGPRYSILERMPYDRETTTMRDFPLCADCAVEYQMPSDRRYHAETISCGDCGPKVWLANRQQQLASGPEAVSQAIAALKSGRIVALKGIGGYQLLVDATSLSAVARLRELKSRPAKPLAILTASEASASEFAALTSAERRELTAPANPIVLATLSSKRNLASNVTNGLRTVGVMLPTTPLHDLLVQRVGAPLVATSGNRDGEPLCYREETAAQELAAIADVFLHHNRPILRPIDDSVVRVMAGEVVPMRLARGLAPLPLPGVSSRNILAVGGHHKAAVALDNGAQAILGPHVGDMDTLPARARLIEQVDALVALYDADPEIVAHDLHPDYFTSRWATEYCGAERRRVRVAVQHHHAHVAAAMLDHDLCGQRVLGIAWDGSGYGTDGVIWGGEFLVSTTAQFERIGTLLSFVLPGGERAIREPWRVAVALVVLTTGADAVRELHWPGLSKHQLSQLATIAQNPRLCVPTTSMGRLFDAVAALTLGISSIHYEGEAAMRLEDACEMSDSDVYPLPIMDGVPWMLDWRPLIRAVLHDVRRNVDPGRVAMRFHRTLAVSVADVATRIAPLSVVLAGGVFQNRVLCELIAAEAQQRGLDIRTPRAIPPGDGGLAAGQWVVAAAQQNQAQCTS